MKKMLIISFLITFSYSVFSLPKWQRYSVQQLLIESAKPTTNIIGSTLASTPALLSASLSIKVIHLLKKHGTNLALTHDLLQVQQQLLHETQTDRILTKKLIHEKQESLVLKSKSLKNTKAMIQSAQELSRYANKILHYCNQHQVKHLKWYQTDLSTSILLANCSVRSLQAYS